MGKNKSSKEIAYISINNPIQFRKHLLLTGVDTIRLLEKYEFLKQIRTEKRRLLLDLKEKLSHLNEASLSVHNFFPEVSEKELKKESMKVEEKIDEAEIPKRSEGYKNLERELRELQEKLANLNLL